jgi:hypothetical protein
MKSLACLLGWHDDHWARRPGHLFLRCQRAGCGRESVGLHDDEGSKPRVIFAKYKRVRRKVKAKPRPKLAPVLTIVTRRKTA